MQFDSLSDFLSMGGYGLYVWCSFGIFIFAMVFLVIHTFFISKQLKQLLIKNEKRQQRIKDSQQHKQSENGSTSL
ncbi:heme exporter protein CcmD [Alteromonas sp. 5E99-2]|uniref:heme exporter protein CcmD n=1 Tax=Alteromonas sp. 5E99-2 TaxID=2817683 RepID=UPI001A999E3F|nr:heme exporter protein CcmD [Alteromonas sp. 5E99-2]MBO1254162.1 heme exporter protein CcmD [Alteromonas sp. 5E99-2]